MCVNQTFFVNFVNVHTDEKWKVVRSFLSPNLTTGKIRNMSSQMVEGIDNWMNEVKQKVGSGTFWPKKLANKCINMCKYIEVPALIIIT